MIKKVFFLGLFLVLGLLFESKAQTKMMQVTTIESTVSGGLGRSKMLITHDDGKTEEQDLENLFSMVGINFKNITGNENTIMKTLKKYTTEGWRLVSVTPLTVSPTQSTNVGIFMTRYLLVKD